MSDLLNLDYINSLPHPLTAEYYDGSTFDVHDIDVETGLMRVFVSGLLQVSDVIDAKCFVDDAGENHDPDTFFSDYELENAK